METKNKNIGGNAINKHHLVKSRPCLRYSVIIETSHTAIEKKESSEVNIVARARALPTP